MLYIIVIFVLFVSVGIYARRYSHNKRESGGVNNVSPECSSCAADSLTCARECAMEAAVRDAEYFEDEELDAYKGRPSSAYTDAEADEFAEVMLTMRPDEVKDWGHSLVRRGINMPDQIKDEYFILIENR